MGPKVRLGDDVDPHGPVARMLTDDAASGALGIEVLAAGPDRATGVDTATARMTVTATMLNGHGIGHGGYVFLLADTAFACACNGSGTQTVAAGAQITYVAPVHEGDDLHAYAVCRTRFGRSGVYDVTVRRGPEPDAPVVAEFRGNSRTLGDQNPG